MGTLKVLDNTAISALLFEIGAVDVLTRCHQRYDTLTSPAIMAELAASKRPEIWHDHMDKIKVEEPTEFDPTALAGELVKRYPSLHGGEISAYLVALRRSVVMGVPVFFVTDDMAMRRGAKRMAGDQLVTAALGSTFNIKETGTVGLVIRMAERGLLTTSEKRSIADDLANSSFRCSADILNKLRS